MDTSPCFFDAVTITTVPTFSIASHAAVRLLSGVRRWKHVRYCIDTQYSSAILLQSSQHRIKALQLVDLSITSLIDLLLK